MVAYNRNLKCGSSEKNFITKKFLKVSDYLFHEDEVITTFLTGGRQKKFCRTFESIEINENIGTKWIK